MPPRRKKQPTPQNRDNPFARLEQAFANGDIDELHAKDLRTVLRFLKYHRQWRLCIGYADTGQVPLSLKRLNVIDRKRVKYYGKVFGVDVTAGHENVHMQDPPDGGGNRADAGARREAKQSRAGLTLKRRKTSR